MITAVLPIMANEVLYLASNRDMLKVGFLSKTADLLAGEVTIDCTEGQRHERIVTLVLAVVMSRIAGT